MVERKRHLVKALTYRVLGSVGSASIAFVFTGDFKIGASIGIADAVAKVGVYYLHERIWYRIKWGVRPAPTDSSKPAKAAEPAAPAVNEVPRQL